MSGWITRVERTLTHDVPGPPDDVRGFYTDLDNIKLVHPLVVSVRTTDRSETADGYVQPTGSAIGFRWVRCTCEPVTLRGSMFRLPETYCPKPASFRA